MLFNSLEFVLFLPIVFGLYWMLKGRREVQNLLILVSSYFFYGCWDKRFLSLIVISTLVDYFVGIAIHKSDSTQKRKWLLSLSLLINLGFLFTFKYFNFFGENFAALFQNFGMELSWTTINIVLPVGISFYTFQTLSYTIDVYRGKIEPCTNLISFGAYVAFFPQLVAGPIERAEKLLPQFYKERHFDYHNAILGCRQILWGMFKKVVVADNCAYFVDIIFNGSDAASGGILLLGAILFAFQIYGDFSGYSDIAIGVAKLFGFDLMKNFAYPYFSRDISEFWRRWHISLSTWFRDYLYIPLGGSRVSLPLQLRNVFAIFLVSGFWHGANWTFFIWGLIHSLLYIPQVLSKSNRNNLAIVTEGWNLGFLREVLRIITTFLVVCVAWIFFRADDLSHALTYIANMLDVFDTDQPKWVDRMYDLRFYECIVFIFILLGVEWVNKQYEFGLYRMFKNNLLRISTYLILALIVAQYFYGESSFIYFQF